ncbi:uncharacterized protein LOC100909120 [Galendromus occidentalis]|uniref:Uncharacterized protein LOC100909120 n=1 Tax=Galendromus occidentalis TaxID=34638 RepID=A0AAJ6QSG5_9ACAR|nr:uncharacterized protein LOC100909120 [Galendromus occidentalis]
MGAFIGWAAFAIKRRKNDSRIFEELETTTRFLDNNCQSVNAERRSQEAVTRMLKEQLCTLRKTMAAHSEFITVLREHDKVLLKKYEEAKRELKRLDSKRVRVEKHYRASRQRLNDLIVDMEDEKRKNGSRPQRDNSWLTQTL